MSWLALDSKGDLARNYGTIAKERYGYHISVIDLRNPTRSDGNNLLTLVNRYMDIARNDPNNLAARAKAEKYAKILSKTIVNPDGDDSNRGQNAFFYDAAEGLLTSVILMLAEFLPPDKDHPQERRHIVSVFKLVQDLLEPSRVKGKSHFQLLMAKLPPDHKARWFAGCRPQQRRAGNGLRHVHRAVPIECLSGTASWSRSCASTAPLTLRSLLRRSLPSS